MSMPQDDSGCHRIKPTTHSHTAIQETDNKPSFIYMPIYTLVPLVPISTVIDYEYLITDTTIPPFLKAIIK